MKYIFTTLTFGFIFLMALALSGQVAEKVQPIPKPSFDSVMINDGRTICEKKSEMNLIEAWEKKCEENGEDKNCSLPKKDVSPMFEYRAWYVNNCN